MHYHYGFVNIYISICALPAEDHAGGMKLCNNLDDVYAPVLSSSAPELQGEWREVKKRAKEKKEKRKKKVSLADSFSFHCFFNVKLIKELNKHLLIK